MSRDGGISRRDAVNCTESRAVRLVLLVFDCLIFGGANDRGNRELRDMLSRCASLCRNSHFVATICMSACVWVAFFAPVGRGLRCLVGTLAVCAAACAAVAAIVPELIGNYASVIAQNLRKALGQLRATTLFRAAFPMRFRNEGSIASSRTARVKSSTSCDLVIRPLVLSSTNSLGPPESETMTGTPEACASMITLPKVSVVLGNAKTSADA